MAEQAYNLQWVVALTPQIGLLVLAALLLILDLVWKQNKRALGWLSAAGLVIIGVVMVFVARPGEEATLMWGGMIRHDWLSFVFQLVFLFGACITALLSMDTEEINRRGEFYLLLVVSTLGMTLMAAATDLVMIFLAIETTSIPLYVLAGFLIRDNKSAEAGFKYLLFGAMTSAVMLYGFTLVFGFGGTTQIYALAELLRANSIPLAGLMGLVLLVLVGFSFKVSAAPFHFWAPDVYEGAPSPVAGFLSTASKAAGFVVLLRFLWVVFPDIAIDWGILLAVLATISMLVGNLLALTQKNIKRLLAYSSIGHAGYILIGLAATSALGAASAVYYLIVYLFTNLAAFAVVTIAGRHLGSDEISAYAGLSRRSPGLALAMLVSVLSLAGVPVFGGFAAKVFVFGSAVESGMTWLAFVGILNSIIGLYYYLNILKVMYLYRSEDEAQPMLLSRPWSIALTVCITGIILLGTVFAPWYGWAEAAAKAIF